MKEDIDEHGNSNHYINSNGVEIWCQHSYDNAGKCIDVKIIRMKFPKGYRSEWFCKAYDEEKTYRFNHTPHGIISLEMAEKA